MNKSEPLAVSFGEVLCDCFEDQTCVGGTAPNFDLGFSSVQLSGLSV